MYPTRTTAQRIALDRSRAEKSPLLDPDGDVLHERRRSHRQLDSLTWAAVAAITVECIRIACTTAGFVWLLVYLLGSLYTGAWL